MNHITIYTLHDAGLPMRDAKNIFDRLARYLDPFHVQIHRSVILKNKPTTTTVTMRALKIKAIEDLIEDRLINPGRSVFSQWVDLKVLITALKGKNA